MDTRNLEAEIYALAAEIRNQADDKRLDRVIEQQDKIVGLLADIRDLLLVSTGAIVHGDTMNDKMDTVRYWAENVTPR